MRGNLFIKTLFTCVSFPVNKMHTKVSKSMQVIFCPFVSIVWFFLTHYYELCIKSLMIRCISVP